jgi:hypothetical protein
MGGSGSPSHIPVYLEPGQVAEPRLVAELQDQYLIGGGESLEGTFTVIGQVSRLLEGNQVESSIRMIRDVPPTQLEVDTISEALANFIEPGRELGVEISRGDINIAAPAVVLRPVAVFQ